MFVKYANAKVLDLSQDGIKTAGLKRLGSFDYEPRTDHKYLYVSARACTADVPNLNYDMLPHEELKDAYRSFIGSYVYFNHDNTDPRKARGAIIDAKYHDEDPDDKWVEILMEMDEEKCPKLCSLMRSGEIDTVSMGCSISSSTCSVCGNTAEFPHQFCEHIQQKGREYGGKLAFEICNGINFFEESIVLDPADPSAHFQGIGKEAIRKKANEDFTYEVVFVNFDYNNIETIDPDGYVIPFDPKHEGESKIYYQGREFADLYFDNVLNANDIFDGYDYGDGDYAIEKFIEKETEYAVNYLNENVEYCDSEYTLDSCIYDALSGVICDDYFFDDDVIKTAKNASIGYIEEMNNGRYYVSCGNEESVDRFWYATADTKQEAIDMLLEDDPEVKALNGYTDVEEIYEMKDFMFGKRDKKFMDSVVDTIKCADKVDNFADAPRQPDEISTVEDQRACPLCGSLTFDGEYCDVCGYQEPPEGFDDIELETDESYEEYEEEAKDSDEETKEAMVERFYDIGDDPELFIRICDDEGFSDDYELVGFDVIKTDNEELQDILESEGAVEL